MPQKTNTPTEDLLNTPQHGLTKGAGTMNQIETVSPTPMQKTLEESWKRCLDLEGWMPSMDVPESVTMTALKSAESAYRLSMRPAGPEARAVAIKKLLSFARTNKIEVPDPASTMQDYNHHLKHLPEDMLEKAVDSITANWKWGNRLPMPGDLLEIGKNELTKRAFHAYKVKMAISRKPPERGPVATSEQIDDIMATHRANLAKRFPSTGQSVKVPNLDRNR